MLKSFTLKNAFSFADESTIDMEATNIKAHSYSLLTSEKNKNVPEGMKILPVMSIYGANASGKSNLVRSLLFVLQSIATGSDYYMLPYIQLDNYSGSEKYDAPSFELLFFFNGDEYTLELVSASSSFYFEKLSLRKTAKGNPRLIYRRSWNQDNKIWDFKVGSKVDAILKEELNYVSKMEKTNKRLLLSTLCTRGEHALFKAITNFTACLDTSEYISRDRTSTGFILTGEDNPYWDKYTKPKSKAAILEFLQLMNPHIRDYQFLANDQFMEEQTNRMGLIPMRLVFKYNSENPLLVTNEQSDRLLSDFESRGVHSAFTLLPAILTALEKGGLVVVDELENSLHPLLMAKVINMFTDPDVNTGGGQLIFTTHNALIMDNKYLRKDEIGFVEKDAHGKSEFYKLSDIEGVRSDLDFCKNYILGAFGAVPKL